MVNGCFHPWQLPLALAPAPDSQCNSVKWQEQLRARFERAVELVPEVEFIHLFTFRYERCPSLAINSRTDSPGDCSNVALAAPRLFQFRGIPAPATPRCKLRTRFLLRTWADCYSLASRFGYTPHALALVAAARMLHPARPVRPSSRQNSGRQMALL